MAWPFSQAVSEVRTAATVSLARTRDSDGSMAINPSIYSRGCAARYSAATSTTAKPVIADPTLASVACTMPTTCSILGA